MASDEIADQLRGIAEQLSELAFAALHEASATAGRGEAPDPALLAEEKRLTRARRAVEKAAGILDGRPTADRDPDPS